MQAGRPDENPLGAIMKKEDYRTLVQNHGNGFFKLTLLKAIVFSIAFVLFVYLITPQSLFKNNTDRILNALVWIASVFAIYLVACLLVWIIKKVKR
jgi:hypothetical protein